MSDLAASAPVSGAPIPKAPAVSSQTDGSPSTTPKASDGAAPNGSSTSSTPAAPAAPASSEAAAGAPTTVADLKLSVEEARALKAKAKWEKEVRAREAKVAEQAKDFERFQKFDELAAGDDALGALRALKGDAFVDKVLRRLNEQIINEGEPDSPAEAARKAVAAELKKQADDAAAAEQARETETQTVFLSTADRYLDAVADKLPQTLRALATGKITRENIWATAKAMHARDGSVTYEALFDYIEGALSPPKPAAPAAPAPKPAATGAPVADLNATTAADDDETANMTKEEFKEYLKKKMGITNKTKNKGYW